jgi:hypothetical protein
LLLVAPGAVALAAFTAPEAVFFARANGSMLVAAANPATNCLRFILSPSFVVLGVSGNARYLSRATVFPDEF